MFFKSILIGIFGLLSLISYGAESTNTSVITTQKQHVYIPVRDYGVDVRDVNFIIFYVKAKTDVHVGLASEESNYQTNVYIITIGISCNTKSAIKEINGNGEKTTHATRSGPYLDESRYRKFIISWSSKVLKLSSSTSVIMSIELPKILPINHIGISTWRNYQGDWIFEIPEPKITSWSTTSPDELQSTSFTGMSSDVYLQTSTGVMTSSEDVLHTSFESSLYQMTSSESVQTSFDSVSPFYSLTFSQEELLASSDSTRYSVTSLENVQTSFDSILFINSTASSAEEQSTSSHLPRYSVTSLETVQSSLNLISSFYSMTSTEVELLTSSDSSRYFVTSLESVQTSFDTISPLSTMSSSADGVQMSSDVMTSLQEGRNNCICFCEYHIKPNKSMSEIIENIRIDLKVNRHNLSSTIRRYISVPDYRPSAVSLGVVGITCLVCTFLVILIPDVLNVVMFFIKQFKM